MRTDQSHPRDPVDSLHKRSVGEKDRRSFRSSHLEQGLPVRSLSLADPERTRSRYAELTEISGASEVAGRGVEILTVVSRSQNGATEDETIL